MNEEQTEATERDDKGEPREPDAPEQVPEQAPEPPPQPEDVQDDGTRLVNLPGLLADEFGISATEARQMVQMGAVEIDGEPHAGDTFNVPHDGIVGKTIIVRGDTKTYQFQYRDEEPPLVGEQRDTRR